MVIKSITIRHFGGIELFSCRFASGLNFIKHRATDELAFALGMVLNSRACPFLPSAWVRRDTWISALVFADERYYRVVAVPDDRNGTLVLRAWGEDGRDATVQYRYLTSHCAQHDASDTFSGWDKSCAARLLQYADPEAPRIRHDISHEDLPNIKTFRSYLSDFKRGFEAERLRPDKAYELVLGQDGRYDVSHPLIDRAGDTLSESEQILFQYLCFLRTAEFWRGFEKLRNLHGLEKPLLIRDFVERLDESIDVGELMRRTAALNRQTLILTVPWEHRDYGEIIRE